MLFIWAWMILPHPARANSSQAREAALEEWSARFVREVDRRLDVPPADQQRYYTLLQQALNTAKVPTSTPQTFVLVDRNPAVQATFVIVQLPSGRWHWIGATPVSTGKPGRFAHFITPLGVFLHTPDNPDYRSQGTYNKNHIRGYGIRGRRVFDFGWQGAQRGWGDHATSKMRLQMHATDPSLLEPLLGTVASEGCIRIPATLNVFLDTHGVLDFEYDKPRADGRIFPVLTANRQVIPWQGRYLVIVDSQMSQQLPVRPNWSPVPASKRLSDPVPQR